MVYAIHDEAASAESQRRSEAEAGECEAFPQWGEAGDWRKEPEAALGGEDHGEG